MELKICVNCHTEFLGRADKKYCDNYCRSGFHNRTLRRYRNIFSKTNSILKKNRVILEKLFLHTKVDIKPVKLKKLLDLGFNFNFQTHLKKLESGKICVCCYDYGYIHEGGDHFTIIQLN